MRLLRTGLLLAAIAPGCAPPPPLRPCAGAAPSKRPWVMRMGEAEATVFWEATESGCVELGLTPEAGGEERIVAGAEREVEVKTGYGEDLGIKAPDRPGKYFMAEVRVAELAPGSCYRYRLAASEPSGGRFCTSRPAGEPIRFLAIGDTAARYGHLEPLVEATADPAPDFVVHVGDLQYYSALLETWANWFPEAAPMFASGAFLPAVGNHEFEIPGEFEDYYSRLFASPGLIGSPRWYRYASGGVHFFSLDTESPLLAGSEQHAWLARELGAVRAEPGFRFSVVYFHRPIYTLGRHGAARDLRAALEPLFREHAVKLVLQGHVHGYERFEVGGVVYITTGGGGAPLYDMNDEVSLYPDEALLRKASAAAYHAVQITVSDRLVGRAVSAAGEEIDRFEVAVP